MCANQPPCQPPIFPPNPAAQYGNPALVPAQPLHDPPATLKIGYRHAKMLSKKMQHRSR
jgi:hypothetical protein